MKIPDQVTNHETLVKILPKMVLPHTTAPQTCDLGLRHETLKAAGHQHPAAYSVDLA